MSECLCVCSVAQSCPIIYGLQPTSLLCPWDFPGKLTGADCDFLLQGIFPTGSSLPNMYSSVQFSSVAQSCPTLCDHMNRSTPGLPVRHQLPEFTQTHIHRVRDAFQPSHPRSSPSPPAPKPSQHLDHENFKTEMFSKFPTSYSAN